MTDHNHIQLVGTVTVGPKGQVVIPSDVRDRMAIAHGTKLVALYLPEKKSIAFITEAQAQKYITKMGERFTNFKHTFEKEKSN